MKKRIIMIRSNPVEPDSRVEKEARVFLRNGWRVLLLVWDREQNGILKDDKDLGEFSVPRIRFGAVAGYGGGMKYLRQYLLFQLRIMRWLLANRTKYDIVHACDFDTANAAAAACRILQKKNVFDIFDFLENDRNAFLGSIVSKRQITLINRADAVVICSEKRKRQIHGSSPKRLAVIHNSPEDIRMGDIRIRGEDRVKIAYVGIFDENRMILELMDAVGHMPDAELHIGGFGKIEKQVIQSASRHGNIYYYGKLSYEDTLALEKQSDIITALYSPDLKNHYYAAPNKFYEGLFLGKPLVMVKNTGMSEIVARNHFGAVIEYHAQGLRQGIRALIAERNNWGRMSQEMKQAYRKYYSWNIMEQRLIQLYESLSE